MNQESRRWTSLAAALSIAFYFVTSVAVAMRRPLWFDEIVTALFAHLPSVATIWTAAARIDAWGMPAPYYFVVHAFDKLLQPPQVATRLPSALALCAGLWLTFDCTRRLTDGVHGLIAIALLTCSFVPYYGYEARSYGIVFMLSACSLWTWTHAGKIRRFAAASFFALFLAGALMHPYFVLCLAPYAVLNLLEWRPRLRPDATVLAGALGILCAVAILSIHVISAHSRRASFPGEHPSFGALTGVLAEIFPAGLSLLAVVALGIAMNRASVKPAEPQPMSSFERLGWLFLVTPLVAYVLARTITNAFSARYLIGMLPGVALAFSCMLWRQHREARAIATGTLVLFACVGAVKQLGAVRHPESIDPFGQQTQMRQVLAMEESIVRDGKQFILISGAMLYMESEYYSKHPERYRYLESENGATSIPAGFSSYYPLRVWRMQDVKEHFRETAVVYPKGDLENKFKQAGIATTVRFAEPIPIVYLQ